MYNIASLTMSSYEDIALSLIKIYHPDADEKVFSGRYSLSYNNGEGPLFSDKAGNIEYPGKWYPTFLSDIEDDDFIRLLYEEGMDHIKRNFYPVFDEYDTDFNIKKEQ